MRFYSLLTLTILYLTSVVSAQQPKHCSAANIDKSSGACTVPDPRLTPGEMNESLVCVSNNDRPRKVTTAEKNTILASYGYPVNVDKSTGEFDHWFPHWMGGSD